MYLHTQDMKLITAAYKKMHDVDLISTIKSVPTSSDGDLEDILAGCCKIITLFLYA